MKKLFRALSILALIGAVVLTGCKKHVNPTPDPTPTPVVNELTLDGTTHQINNAVKYVEGGDVELLFTVDGYAVFYEFEGEFTEVPTGKFELTEDGVCQGELSGIGEQEDYDLIGSIEIEKAENIYTIKATGTAVKEGVTKAFTMTYQGELVDANEPQGAGKLTVGDKEVNLITGMCGSVEEQGMQMLTITLADMNETNDDTNMISFIFNNYAEVPTGTFEFSFAGPMAMINFNDESYMSSTGTVTISKEGDVYTIVSEGTTMEYGKETFSCNYVGKLIEMSVK